MLVYSWQFDLINRIKNSNVSENTKRIIPQFKTRAVSELGQQEKSERKATVIKFRLALRAYSTDPGMRTVVVVFVCVLVLFYLVRNVSMSTDRWSPYQGVAIYLRYFYYVTR